MRVVLLLLLALLASPVLAGNPGTYVNQAAAQTACNEWGAYWVNVFATDANQTQTATYTCVYEDRGTLPDRYLFTLTGQPGGFLRSDDFLWQQGGDCPPGFGADPLKPTECLTPDKCRAKPALGSTFTVGSMSPTTCVAGCQFMAQGGSCISTNGSSACAVTGATPTGQACAAGDKPPQGDKPQECVPTAAGSMCIKPDGDECYSAGPGRQMCWEKGETGEKDDQNVKQKRDAGTEPQPPDLNLPNGDNLSPQGPPVQSTTNSGAPPNVRVITTVTQNYGTANGTNAGSSNSGESSSGDGSGKEGDGDDSLGEEAAGLDTDDGSGDHAGESAWGNENGDGFTGDASGFGFGNSCPAPPQVRGQTLDWSGLCELMTYVGMLVLAAAHMHALYIIAGD